MTAEELRARVLHLDHDVLILDKPAGLLVHPGPRGQGSLGDFLPDLWFEMARPPALVSISSTLAPFNVVVTTTTGRSTFGKRSTPNLGYAARPSTIGALTSMTVKIGRRMQSSQMFILKSAFHLDGR